MFTVRGTDGSLASLNKTLQFMMLLIATTIIHGLVLRFFFPGYYDPLWPIHSDFYLPAEIANSHANIFSYLTWPRPTGMVFFALIGKLGIHGSIAAIIFLVILNVVATALLIKKLLALNFDLKFVAAFIVYGFLLFSHPYFYSFYVHDAFSQLSYFLLLMGLFSYCALFKKSVALALFSLFTFLIVGFLAKETFGVAALVVSAIWFLYYRKNSLRDSIMPFASVLTALIATFTFNFFIKSSFVTNSNTAYRVDLSPASILTEWFHYIKLGYNFGTVLLLIVIGFLVFSKLSNKSEKLAYIFIGCVLAFAAALLPNSLLPDHKHNGYSWTGAYILFAPILFLAIPNFFSMRKKNSIVALFSLLTLFLMVHQVVNLKKYKNSSNQWIIFQENTQRNLLTSLKPLMEKVAYAKNGKILISGISFPFSPFHNPRSIFSYLRSEDVSFDVVSYATNAQVLVRNEKVRDVTVDNINFSDYSMIWIFGSDGRLVKALDSKDLGYSFELLTPLKNFILFPDVAIAIGIEFEPFPKLVDSDDGYKLLQSGNSYLTYQRPLLALEYFQKSAKRIPENPYPWYMAGIELEKLGRLIDAKQYFQKAVDLDPKNQNPAFSNALLRVGNTIEK